MNRAHATLFPPATGFRLCVLLGAALLPAAAQPLPPPSAAKESIKFHVARSGEEVLLSWELPSEEVRMVEIYRNNQIEVKGRRRCAMVRPLPATALDTVPDGTRYWYWLKVIFKDGQIRNIGPAMTPPAQVWVP